MGRSVLSGSTARGPHGSHDVTGVYTAAVYSAIAGRPTADVTLISAAPRRVADTGNQVT